MYEEDNLSYDSTEAELDELLTPELLEFRLGNEISRRGWLLFMNMESRCWDRRYCVSLCRGTPIYHAQILPPESFFMLKCVYLRKSYPDLLCSSIYRAFFFSHQRFGKSCFIVLQFMCCASFICYWVVRIVRL